MNSYGPAMLFNQILWNDLYKDNTEMSDFIERHYVGQTIEGLQRSAPPKGLDEYCEEYGKKWKSGLTGQNEESCQQACTLMHVLDDIRETTMKVLSIEDSYSRQRPFVNVEKYRKKVLFYLDYYGPARRKEDGALLTDFSGVEKHTIGNGVHLILERGVVKVHEWQAHFIANGGESKSIPRTSIVDDAALDPIRARTNATIVGATVGAAAVALAV